MLDNMNDPASATHHQEMATLLDHVTELLDWDTLIGCYIDGTNHTVMLPWHYVPKLVAQRMVGHSFVTILLGFLTNPDEAVVIPKC